MRYRRLGALLLLATLISATGFGDDTAGRFRHHDVPHRSTRIPASFEENVGQTENDIRFLARGFGQGFHLCDRGTRFLLSNERQERLGLHLEFEGATGPEAVAGERNLGFMGHHFRGNGGRPARMSAPNFEAVRYVELYPGIDLVFHGDNGLLEFDIVLSAGADLGSIQLHYLGQESQWLDEDGSLILETPVGALRRKPPNVYRNLNGQKRPIESHYAVRGDGRFGLAAGPGKNVQWPRRQAAVSYSTFLGGGGGDWVSDVAVDDSGNVYLTGHTTSPDFPVASGIQETASEYGDAFVMKLNPTGSGIVYATYLGGSLWDRGEGIFVNTQGEVYLTGSSSSEDFPVTVGSFRQCCGVFAAKIGAAGDSLTYSTFVGSGDPTAITVDSAGGAIITGSTRADFPTTAGAYEEVCCRGYDGFVAKLQPGGSGLAFSTMLGGSGSDYARDVAIGQSGELHIVGETYSPDFPTTQGAAQTANRGGWDMFVTKMLANGTGLVYSTYAGGSLFDYANSVAVDGTGQAYVGGDSESHDFPATVGVYGPVPVGTAPRGVVLRVDPSGSSFPNATYLPGKVASGQLSVALEPAGSVIVAGSTNNPSYPITAGAPQGSIGGYYDVFLSRLTADLGSMLSSTFFGGAARENLAALAVSPEGNIYITGDTGSSDFPTTAGGLQSDYSGNGDGFLAVFEGSPASCSYLLDPASAEFDAGGGAASIGVNTDSGCAWSAITTESWISVSSGSSSGVGSGVVDIDVEANTGGPRTGVVRIAGEDALVTQSANQGTCTFAVDPASQSAGINGGSFWAAIVASRPECEWTATEDLSWVAFTTAGNGAGSGSIQYSVGANPGTSREANISIAGHEFMITQSGACQVSLAQESTEFTEWGGTRDLHFTAGCTVDAASASPWLEVLAVDPSGGLVTYSVARNHDGQERQSTITIGDKVLTVRQQAATGFPAAIDLEPTGGTGDKQRFDLNVWHNGGREKIYYIQLNFSNPQSALNACYIHFDPANGVVYLLDDNATQWFGMYSGTGSKVSNSQCLVHGTSGTTGGNESELWMEFEISFRPQFTGVKNSFVYVGDVDGKDSGWLQIGAWNAEPDPHLTEVAALSPNSGSGTAQTFSLTLTDSDGADDIWFAQISLNHGLDAYNGCYIHNDPDNNVYYLLNDTATGWFGMFGGSGQVENSQCRLIGAGSSNTRNGNDLTITYRLEFKHGFSGAKEIYVNAAGKDLNFFPWRKVGNWTVP